MASARAISSRLRPGVPSDRAGEPASGGEAGERQHLLGARRAAARWPWRRKAPTMTFSTTVMSSNVTGTWKVRAMPSRACASGVARWSRRWSQEADAAGGRFGVARQAVEERALAGAVRADQADDLALGHVQVGAIHRAEGAEGLDDAARLKQHGAPPGGDCRMTPQRRDAAGLEAGDQHDDGAVDDEGDAGAAAAEQPRWWFPPAAPG